MKSLKLIFLFLIFSIPTLAWAGNISSSDYTAKLLSDGSSINFGYFSTNSSKNVSVEGDELTGYIWGENIGWVSLNCSNNNSCGSSDFKVTNDGNGNLSGYAWGENAGWVNFGPFSNNSAQEVTISGGDFEGYAWSENFGWIQFDCDITGACVNTSWRPTTSGGGGGNPPVTYECNDGVDNDADGSIDYPIDTGCSTANDNSEINIFSGGGGGSGGGDPVGGDDPVDEGGGEVFPPDFNNDDFDIDPGDVLPPSLDGGDPNIEPPSGCEFETTIIGVIWCTVVETFDYTVDTFSVAIEEMDFILNNGYGNIIVKIIGIVGILFGAIFSVLPRLFGTPFSFSEISLLPYRLWSALMSAFGLKKRARPWGTVYDAITKQPLDPVIVTLQDLEGKEIQTSITDMDGRYGFLVAPGMYRLLPKKTHYAFPSLKLVGKTRDEIYLDLYFGNVFEVKGEGDVIVKNIPMDPMDFDWNEFAKRDQKLMKFYSKRDMILTRFADAFFSFGFTISVIALLTAPSTYNIFIFCLYLVLLVLRETGIKTQNFGKVLDSQGNPLSFAIIKVFNAEANVLISKKVANKYGQYYCLVQQGNYFVEIEQKIGEDSYKPIFKSGTINAKKGYINENFKINLND